MKYLLIPLIALAGCASPEQYSQYLATQQAIETARFQADAERSRAVATIAQHGTDTTKVAAVMSLMGQTKPVAGAGLQPPKNEALQWASVIIPGLTNIAGFYYGARVSMNASDNAAAVSLSTNEAFVGMAQTIQAPGLPQANVTTITQTQDSHDTSLAGTGVIGNGIYSPFTDNSVYSPTTDNSVLNPYSLVPTPY